MNKNSLNKPTVSLAICNFNREKYLRRAVQSCLSQNVIRRHIEVIVVDDASTDGSCNVINEFSSELKVIRHKKNLGIGAASSSALAAASGEYFIRVDSDDYISSELVSTFAPVLDHNEDIDFVYGDLQRIDQNGKAAGRIFLNTDEVLKQHGAGILFRKKTLLDVGGYNASLRNSEDFELLTRLIKHNSMGHHLPIPLYRYHASEDNLSEKLSKRSEIESAVRKKYGI
jgi:glycosyltransferase involved in cell wall biosynthesis